MNWYCVWSGREAKSTIVRCDMKAVRVSVKTRSTMGSMAKGMM